ncbi:MAG: PAS domain S-box protein, partial [Candidatus Cloacimonetes bacterium]|nr:PAS domain S-box protein [Candidatus Cloacimonadota bacterium]
VREKNKAQNYLDVAGVILLVINNQENVVLINKKGCETIGLPAEKIIGLNWFDNFLPEEIRETVRHDFHQILRNKLSQHKFYESEIITSNNLRKTILWQNTVLTDDEGQITGTLSSGEDITQSKLAEFKLMESERRLKKIIENNPDGIIFLAHDNSILYVNKMAEKMFHKTQIELLNTSFQYPYSLDKFSELEIIRNNEPTLTVEMNFIETEWAGEKAYLGTFRDITDKLQTTRELNVQKAYLEELFEGAPAAVVVLDNKDRVLKVNRKFTSLFGYSISEARGKMINDLLVPDNLKEEGFNSTITVARGNNVDLETIRKTKDGKLINVSVIGRPIRLERDQIAVYALYEDITERKRAENALRASEEKYRNLVEFIEEGIVMIDRQENFIFANQAAAKIFGFDNKKELIGKNLGNFVPEEIYADLSRKTFMQKKGEITRFEFPITTVNGNYRYLNITANPMFIDEEYQYTFGIFNDLTARIAYEKELQNTKDFLEKIMESVNNGVFTLNLNGEFTLVNKALTEITGYSYSELIHKPIRNFVEPQMVKILTSIITDIIQRGKIFINQDVSLTTKSGESVILKFNFAPMIEDGKIFSVVGSLENITKQKKAETALRESELRFRKLFKSSPDAILLADLQNFQIVDANPATENLIGKKLEDIIGMDMIEMFPSRLRDNSEINLLNYLTGRESPKEPKFKIYLQNSDGFEIPVAITATEVQIKGANYLLANIRDETVRTNAENKIISQGEQLKLINKILRHDLSNNLTSIHSGIKLYHKTEQDIFLNEATKNVNKSIELIREMREFETFMAEHENLKIIALKDIFSELQINYPDILIFNHDQVKVLADETIRSIFNNLISNAVKHGKADKIKITTQKDKKNCIITVENDGKKIPANITEKIFEEGFKYGKTGNTGLGLYIVRSAMKRFGGDVRLGTNQSGKVEFILELKTV